jgi:iron complex transport system ATP-binding protein
MRALAEGGYEVTAGATAQEDVVAMLRRASLVIVCDAPYGAGNVGNLHAVLRASEEGIRVLLLERVPVGERDFTGGEATRLWGALRERASVARSYEELLAAAAPR